MITVTDLAVLGRSLAVDTDHLLTRLQDGAALLIHLAPPADYPYESHKVEERIVCIQGKLNLETEAGTCYALLAGQMALIPPGLRHRFAADSDGVILTLFGGA